MVHLIIIIMLMVLVCMCMLMVVIIMEGLLMEFIRGMVCWLMQEEVEKVMVI